MGDFLVFSFKKFLLCFKGNLLLYIVILHLNFALFSDKVLVTFQDVNFDAIEIGTFLVTKSEEHLMKVLVCHEVTMKMLVCHEVTKKMIVMK